MKMPKVRRGGERERSPGGDDIGASTMTSCISRDGLSLTIPGISANVGLRALQNNLHPICIGPGNVCL